MEDDKGLVLSLGLPSGRTSSPSKDNSGNSLNGRTNTDERTSKILNDFRKFLNAGVPQTVRVNPTENFVNNFRQTTSGGNDSSDEAVANENKRKHTFADMTNPKKHETDSYSSDLQVKGKNSHISITTDEGSTGDNEDVADSEAVGSTSKCGSASSSRAPKDTDGKSNIGAASFPVQTAITSESSPSTPVYPLSAQSITTDGGQPCALAASAGSVAMNVTHSSAKISGKESPWGMSQPQPLRSPYTGSLTPTSDSLQATTHNSSDATRPDVQSPEQVDEEGTTVAGSNSNFPSKYPAISPGIAAEVNFGGSGSSPNLPWVSTTGPGPNGKTISGVTYKYNSTLIKIVCACHGIHLSPEEFIQHATQDVPSAVTSTDLAYLQSSNPAITSAMN